MAVAILAAVAVTALVWLQVKPNVEAVIAKRNEFEQKFKTESAEKSKVKKELGETKTKLESTEKNLAETTKAKTAAEARANELDAQSKALNTQLTQTREELAGKNQQLAAWNALGLAVDQVKGAIIDLKQTREANGALEEEKKLLVKENKRLVRELDIYRGTNEVDVALPSGTKGRVLVVDPKWDFVVLDLGTKQDVVPNGVLMVSREGKLVGKVRITAVQQDRCIANVVPGWKLAEILEGDQVFY
ncbi:MAG TPA: hypothetical protein DCM86_06120 [Verrucomicrobiales bacterium]|nr:hypothetical protein [Verrucomicrobiales bacterium]